jgi:peptide/nickel transport system substrate-binding protein
VLARTDPNSGQDATAVGEGAVWVADNSANAVTRIDPTGLLTPTAVGNAPTAVAAGAGGVWVADSLDNAVVRIDPATRAVTTTVRVGRSPSDIAVGEGSVWVVNSGDGTVSRIDPGSGKVTATIAVGGSPQAIALAHGRAWVTIDERSPSPPDEPTSATLRMETLGGDLFTVDPALAYSPSSWQLMQATCAQLVNLPDKSGPAGSQIVPEVATSLPVPSAGGKTYTFTIRDGFRFSPPSNQPVTAQTFKDTIERSLSPAMKSPTTGYFTNIVGASAYMSGKARHISGVTARGHKLVVRLTAPQPDFLARLTLPIFCAVPSGTPVDPKGLGVIASAGPYYITSYVPNQSVVLTRNPNYRGSRPHRLERIELTVGVSSQQAVADIERGKADYTTIQGTPVATVRALTADLAARYGPGSAAAAHGDQRYFATPVVGVEFFILNTHRPLFRDVRLRQAVNFAIDRGTLAPLGNGFGGADRPADHYLPPGLPGASDAKVYPLRADPAKARALARGHGRTAILYVGNWPGSDTIAQVITRDLAAIGLRVTVRKLPPAALYNRLQNRDEPFDLAMVNWLPDYPDPGAMLAGVLGNSIMFPPADLPGYHRSLAAAARLSGPERYLAYGRLDLRLARDAAPVVAFGIPREREFFSPRIGCQKNGFRVGADLAALCIKRPRY